MTRKISMTLCRLVVAVSFLTLCLIPLSVSLGQETTRKAGDSQELTIEGIKYAFRWCPPGEFLMGSPKDEANRNDNETQHPVTLTRGFWMLETPVTQEMWESIMGKNPSRFKGAKLPVEQVSWGDCQEFVGGLNDLKGISAGFKFAMPTEAQWEYACRAGTTTAFYSGGALNAKLANFEGKTTTEVGSYPANAWGLRDMHGNVWEWCLDGYSGDYASGAVTDPLGVSSSSGRYVCRGGSWYDKSWHCRSASREYYGNAVTRRDNNIGFRLVLISTGNASDVAPRKQSEQGAVKDITGNVDQFLRGEGWRFTKKEGTEQDVYQMELENRPYNLLFIVRKKEEQLFVLTVLKQKVAESHRLAVMEYLTRINYDNFRVGNFTMDLSDGEVQFRIAIDVEHGVINPKIVEQLTLSAAQNSNKYFPGINEVESGKTPTDVLGKISD